MPVNDAMVPPEIVSERDALLAQNAILREANKNLLLATFGAQDSRDHAEAAQQTQNEFLAMLAHELRNPLAPIGMASTMLGKLPEPSVQLLRIKAVIDRQVGQLSRLLDDLLDAARIASGKIELHLEALLVAEQLTNAVQTVESRVAERHQHLSIDLPGPAVWISGDSVRLAQVFSNLLVNASKFTPDGGHIRLRVRVEDLEAVIVVEDDGAGVAADFIPLMFTLFAQGARTLARSEGGLGVGLNIVRNVIEMHGGTVHAASPGLGRGATFTVRLPLLKTDQPAHVVVSAPSAPMLRQAILVIEDNPDAGDMLALVLKAEHHLVTTARDGVGGLALACSGKFTVVLCDIGLPGMNGYELVQAMRTRLGARAPFCIAISGYGQRADRTRALAAGFDEHLVKPVDIESLLQLIGTVGTPPAQARIGEGQ